jgi:2-polyprenyl-3-methyl-5-hydroxy-6-metoxy-1,4-benzoquinol methylase
MQCPLCGSTSVRTKYSLDKEHSILFCSQCTLQYLSPQLSDEALQQLYSEKYYSSWGIKGQEENESTRQMKMATFSLRMNLIKQFRSSGKVLDIGCATGYFLEVAKEEGFEAYGVEYSAYAAQIAQNKFGVNNIFKGTLEQCNFPSKYFDVIAMSDLIEHVRDPIQTMSKAASLLKNDGVIMIMTPDSNSLSRFLMGKKWGHYKLEHFFYLNSTSMKFLASKCSLEANYFERSKKALNLNYLHTQLKTYKHWLLTPLTNIVHSILPKRINAHNFHIAIGEMVVILKKSPPEESGRHVT